MKKILIGWGEKEMIKTLKFTRVPSFEEKIVVSRKPMFQDKGNGNRIKLKLTVETI